MVLQFPLVTKLRDEPPREDVPHHNDVPRRPSRAVLQPRPEGDEPYGQAVPHQGEGHPQVL